MFFFMAWHCVLFDFSKKVPDVTHLPLPYSLWHRSSTWRPMEVVAKR